MSVFPLDSETWAHRCNDDGEFQLAARYWDGGVRFSCGDTSLELAIVNGLASPGNAGANVLEFSAIPEIWEPFLAELPPRLMLDPLMLEAADLMNIDGDLVRMSQYYPAIMRAIELIRQRGGEEPALSVEQGATRRHDSPVGRYVHLDINGQDYRIYYETAGQGIPMVLQHTAGCHGTQWRHLMECREVTDHFQLIAYDLPFHGKSVPPVGQAWWQEHYQLTADFVRRVPIALADALKLEKPVFMGCSVGGMLALDLARHHPDSFRAVISLEGGLKVEDPGDSLNYLWHPQVSNEFKARLMNGIMSPTSPISYRKETSQIYAAGWPPVFLGDLNYYIGDYDLRQEAENIDTSQLPVYILSGEYDASGTAEMGREAHEAIAGSEWHYMEGLGHFPMSEDPARFHQYLLPVLEKIRLD